MGKNYLNNLLSATPSLIIFSITQLLLDEQITKETTIIKISHDDLFLHRVILSSNGLNNEFIHGIIYIYFTILTNDNQY